jgi:hypothetical protein
VRPGSARSRCRRGVLLAARAAAARAADRRAPLATCARLAADGRCARAREPARVRLRPQEDRRRHRRVLAAELRPDRRLPEQLRRHDAATRSPSRSRRGAHLEPDGGDLPRRHVAPVLSRSCRRSRPGTSAPRARVRRSEHAAVLHGGPPLPDTRIVRPVDDRADVRLGARRRPHRRRDVAGQRASTTSSRTSIRATSRRRPFRTICRTRSRTSSATSSGSGTRAGTRSATSISPSTTRTRACRCAIRRPTS